MNNLLESDVDNKLHSHWLTSINNVHCEVISLSSGFSAVMVPFIELIVNVPDGQVDWGVRIA